MDQYLDNRHKEVLWDLLANPAEIGQLHTTTLQRLVNDHPQSGLLQVLLARATGAGDLKKAAAYFNAKILHKLVYNADSFLEVNSSKIVSGITSLGGGENYSGIPVADDETGPIVQTDEEERPQDNFTAKETEAVYINDRPETVVVPNISTETEITYTDFEETTASVGQHPKSETGDIETEVNAPVNIETEEEVVVETSETETAAQSEQVEGVHQPEQEQPAEELQVENTFALAEDPEPEPEHAYQGQDTDAIRREEKEYFRQDIDDEIYDEIVGIEEIGIDKPIIAHTNDTVWPDTEEQEYRDEEVVAEGEQVTETTLPQAESPTVYADEEKLILGNIVSADYLSFDKKLDELRNGRQQQLAEVATTETAMQPVAEKQDVLSRYNDEQMPYSFMWWLDKTRKEHAGTFQPFVADMPPAQPAATVTQNTFKGQPPVKPIHRNAPDELQQQYYENIFSLTSVSSIEGDDSAKKVEFDHNKKEDVIIERFITAEPQIKPPAADKLDNENKAKKSSEDQDVLVTETLARIYTDQMLYHKAIATYKKLLLKFPEKKLYFAAQIEQLEKKTN